MHIFEKRALHFYHKARKNYVSGETVDENAQYVTYKGKTSFLILNEIFLKMVDVEMSINCNMNNISNGTTCFQMLTTASFMAASL